MHLMVLDGVRVLDGAFLCMHLMVLDGVRALDGAFLCCTCPKSFEPRMFLSVALRTKRAPRPGRTKCSIQVLTCLVHLPRTRPARCAHTTRAELLIWQEEGRGGKETNS